jgi:hypothetical protein
MALFKAVPKIYFLASPQIAKKAAVVDASIFRAIPTNCKQEAGRRRGRRAYDGLAAVV